MAPTFNSRRLRHERAMSQRLLGDHRNLAQAASRILLRQATTRNDAGETIIPNSRRARTTLKSDLWSQVLKPYYIGPGQDAFDGPAPRSPYAQLLFTGIEGAMRLQAERQAALLRRVIHDAAVLNWLTGPRPIRASREIGVYDPFHLWVDPNGYRLNDRIWRASIDVRSRVDSLLDYHIALGTSAVRMAELLETFLTPSGATPRTRTPYGTDGSYAARRLARTEITAAAGRATVQASVANPFVIGVKWSLSAAHPRFDVCDGLASGGPGGDGVYPPGQVPTYPPHPQCLCNLSPVAAGNVSDLVEQLRAEIRGRTPAAQSLQGVFNVEWLISALIGGFLDDVLEAAA
jgi:hypothetical protein